MHKTLLAFIVVFGYTAYSQSKDCLKYEPVRVDVSGIAEQDTFPGRPNYESIKDGDEPEIFWILKLTRSVCMEGIPGDDIDHSENDIDTIQLEMVPKLYDAYRGLLGKRVIVSGSLTHGFSGHHKTEILLHVVSMVVE